MPAIAQPMATTVSAASTGLMARSAPGPASRPPPSGGEDHRRDLGDDDDERVGVVAALAEAEEAADECESAIETSDGTQIDSAPSTNIQARSKISVRTTAAEPNPFMKNSRPTISTSA